MAQNIEKDIAAIELQLEQLEQKKIQLLSQLEDFKLAKVREDIQSYALPQLESGEELINHNAMSLVYSEEHEQAKWVAHVITPDILHGTTGRTNDFREDEKVKSGTAVEKDYFLTNTLADGSIEYDGFGYDRGHLAPSADFRWSQKALSESYLYSNMSPQLPGFNRKKWGELEGMLRGYIYQNPEARLMVVTGPVLEQGLPVIERSINKPSIPKQYFKVVIDMKNKRGIGFLMPNQDLSYPVESFAKSIDEIEELTGINFFHQVDDDLETKLERMDDTENWLSQSNEGDVLPMKPTNLPPNHFNTAQINRLNKAGKRINVCGTIVHSRYSRKGNAMLYVDKGMNDPALIVFVKKEDLDNFSYDPTELKGKQITVTGKIIKFDDGTPAMFIKNEKQIGLYQAKK